MAVGIVGGRGCGKSVFVSLLASTAINYSVESKEHFRYYTDATFTGAIGDIISCLKMRSWPPANLKGTLSEYSFYFGYSSWLTRWLMMGEKRFPSWLRPPKERMFKLIQFSLFDMAGEDVELVRQQASIAKERGTFILDELSTGLRTVLDSDVLTFLIDLSRITTDVNEPSYQEMLEYDTDMATLISLVAQYRSKKYGTGKRLYPVFVLTKFDMLDPKVMRALGITEGYATWLRRADDQLRNRTAEAIMKKFFQHTLALILGGAIMGVELERGKFFFSYLATELNEEGILVPRLISDRSGLSHELDYSISEYKEFIRFFGQIAGKIRHMRGEPGHYVTGIGR